MTFQTDTAVTDRDGVLVAEVSRAWEIWGPNGGYLAAIALRTAGSRAPAGHRPASISVQYLSRGQFGEARLSVELLREARSAACLAVEMTQEGKRILHAQVWTTNKLAGQGPAYDDLRMPEVPRPEDLPPPSAYGAKERHRFWENFDNRPVGRPSPDKPDPRGARFDQWVRYKDFGPTDDPFLAQARALQMIDTLLWPAHRRRGTVDLDYVAPSLDVSVWFHAPSGDVDWLLVEAHAAHARAGLIHGSARVWATDGRLIASGGSNMLHTPLARG